MKISNANLRKVGDALLYGSGIGITLAGFQESWVIMAVLVGTAVLGKYLSTLSVRRTKKQGND